MRGPRRFRRPQAYALSKMEAVKNLHVLVGKLLSTAWGSRFEPFTPRELRILNGFNDFGWQLGNRSFFASPCRIHVGTETRLEHAGTEALELAGITLRQAWLPKDVGHHGRVLRILRKRVADGDDHADTLMILDDLERRFGAALAEPLMTLVDADDLRARRWPKVVAEITAAEVLDSWLHGTVVHLNPEKAAAVKRWSPVQYEWTAIKATTSLTRIVLATHVVVRGALGVLEQDRRAASGPGITATAARSN